MAVVGQVPQAHAAGRGAVAKTRRGAVGVVLLVGVRPILAAAQHQHPFVLDLDLVLQIQAQRIGTRIDAVVGGGVQHRHRAVHGVVDVRQRRHRAGMPMRVIAAAVVVQPPQHGVLQGAAVQLQFQRGIGCAAIRVFAAADHAAPQASPGR
ncbi:hypothetical protein G6F65_021120 [Rhizopus arrhizus]|nr:hypothetical protein G6F65_021120 [Rhizopus arrhizus]